MVSPFISKTASKSEDYPIGYLLSRASTKGEIGLEIEVEGNKFKKEGIPEPWAYTHDGSLRGKDNAEYILRHPVMFDRVPEAVNTLWQMFQSYGSKLDESNRTSVHVHLNMQMFHLNRLAAFLAMYFSIEELLAEWCGDHRVGNLFCLRAKDASGIVSRLKRFIQSDCRDGISDGMHYAGLNAHALHKFGSIEIRTLRGATDPKVITDWVSILERLYTLSAQFKDPRDLVNMFSAEGPMNYLSTILGDREPVLMAEISYDPAQIREILYTGVRFAQDLAYCRDWSLYNPVEVRVDPFGRTKRKSASLSVQQIVYGQTTPPPLSNLHWSTLNPATEIPMAPVGPPPDLTMTLDDFAEAAEMDEEQF